MTWPEFGSIMGAIAAGTVVVSFVGRILIHSVKTMRTNDLQHIDSKLDVISVQITEHRKSTDALAERFDEHLNYHLEHKL